MMDALAKARAEFGPIRRSKTVNVRTKAGGNYTFSYAPLEAILAAVIPALSKHGIAVSQTIVDGHVVTELHITGSTHALAPVPIGLRDEMTPQERGSAITYARRYSLTLALCISADDDDDGNAASGNVAKTMREEEPAPPPEVSTELLDRAADFAGGGLEAYRQFYVKLTAAERKAIGPHRHADFKLLAEGVDAARH